jgi:hypothetical protein
MFSNLLSILAEYGLASTLTIISLSIIFYTIYHKIKSNPSPDKKQDSEGQLYSEVENETKAETIQRRKNNLLKHDFFSNLKFKTEIDLPLETFTELPNRNKLYVDLVILLLTEYRNNLISFIEVMDPYGESSKWATTLHEYHYTILDNFVREAEAAGIPEEAVKIFKSFFGTYAQKIYLYINNIAKLPDTSVIDKTKMILLLLELILVTAVADIKKMKVLNGTLNGMEYDGLIIEDA